MGGDRIGFYMYKKLCSLLVGVGVEDIESNVKRSGKAVSVLCMLEGVNIVMNEQ